MKVTEERQLVDATISEYLDMLASSSPTPGGGSCAALSAALGAGLINMVCALTVGRKRFAQYQGLLTGTIEELNTLISRLTGLIDEDARAYNMVMVAFRLPRYSDDEKKSRCLRIQDALVPATETPLEIVGCCRGTLGLVGPLHGKLNHNVLSDLAAGVDLVAAAAHAASHNANVNITMMSDEEIIGRYTEIARSALAEVDALAFQARERLSGGQG